MTDPCPHGHIDRICELCEKDDEISRLTAERDAAFAMSQCQCGTGEACANLVALAAERDALREDAQRWRWVIRLETEGPGLFVIGDDGKRGRLLFGEAAIAAVDAARKGSE